MCKNSWQGKGAETMLKFIQSALVGRIYRWETPKNLRFVELSYNYQSLKNMYFSIAERFFSRLLVESFGVQGCAVFPGTP